MSENKIKDKLYRIIFKRDTKAGYLFDIIVIVLVLISVALVIVGSVRSIHDQHEELFQWLHWALTFLFTIEYFFRLYAAKDRWKYATSFLGIVDLLAILPSYFGIFIAGGDHFVIIRILRLLRIVRIFEMGHFVREGAIVASALRASRTKIIVFLGFIVIAAILMGSLMYMVEVKYNPRIQNIPEGIYWAIVTLTTVGYGDTVPITYWGRVLASIVMIMGYGIIAVPTGIVTAEISARVLGPRDRLKIKCQKCGDGDHLKNSSYCHHCGEELKVAK